MVGNEYLQSAAPWTAIRTDPARAAAITRFAFNLIRLYAVLSRPFLPDAADAMLAALQGAIDAASADTGVRAVVITGTGPAFCAGHDLRELTRHRRDPDGGRAFTERLMQAIERLRPEAAVMTPSYAAYLAETFDVRQSSVERLLVAGSLGPPAPPRRVRYVGH